jgi:hypothetical protein
MKTWEATVKVPGPSSNNFMQVKTIVQATDYSKAKMLLEAQYGKKSIVSNPKVVNNA